MKNILFQALFLFSTCACAQNFDAYEPLHCSGKVPEEFLLPSTQKYKSDLSRLEKKDLKKSERKNQKQFALESNFVLDDLLQSGLVLFGDPVSAYLNEVAAKVLETDKGFKKNIQVYALRSAVVNAFAADRGTIFVSLGLLAQLENEAQLAYILSHELSHVQDGHALDLFLEARSIGKRSGQQRVMSESTFDEKLLAKNRYSKELEIAADKKGLERYLQTDYSLKSVETAFDVLQYAHLPFDEVAFERNFFEAEHYKFPDAYWLASVKAINTEPDKEDDPESTHPSVEKRRQLALEMLTKAKEKSGSEFLVSKERFMQIRQIARFELPMLHLHQERCGEAVYAAHLLLQKFPKNAYLEKCISKALYINAKFENDNDYTRKKDYTEIEGEAQRVNFLFDTMSPKEATILATRYAWMQHKLHPEDGEIKAMVEDLFAELALYTQSLSDFVEELSPISEETAVEAPKIPEVKSIESKEKSKYEKIKAKKIEQQKNEPLNAGWKGAFAGMKNDEAFEKAFKAGQEKHAKRKKIQDHYESDKGRKERKAAAERSDRKGRQLGIKKIVIVNPFYLKLDARKENAVQYVQSENGQENLHDLIEDIAPKTGIKATVLDITDLKSDDTERFNEIRLLNEWFEEQIAYENLNITYGINQGKVNAIAEKYGTDHFLWTGVVSLREKKRGSGLLILASFLYPLALPGAIYLASKPEYDMFFYAVLYNVRDGSYRTIKFEYFDQRDSKTMLRAHYYDALMQIKTPPAKK